MTLFPVTYLVLCDLVFMSSESMAKNSSWVASFCVFVGKSFFDDTTGATTIFFGGQNVSHDFLYRFGVKNVFMSFSSLSKDSNNSSGRCT